MQVSSQNRYKELLEELFRRETANDLFALKTNDGIAYWDLVRTTVFTHIMGQAGIMPEMSTAHLTRSVNLRNRIKALLLLPVSLYHATSRKKQKGTILTLNISRTWSVEKNGFVDLLFEDIHKELGMNCFHLELFTRSKKEVIKWSNREKHFLIQLEINKLWNIQNFNESLPVISCFNDLLPTDFPLSAIIREELFHYRMEFSYYRQLLRRKGITHVFLQSQPKSLIAASRELGIPTYDLQHGHFNSFDPYYSYSKHLNVRQLKTVTQHLLTVGCYWNQFVHPGIKTITLGNTYFYPEAPTAEAKRDILIIGSRFIHSAILEDLKTCAKLLPEEHFVYKLHSNQSDQVLSTQHYFRENTNVSIRIFDDINELLQQAKWLILVQSTVAYQALQIGIPVCIYKKYYFEASEDLFDREDVVQVESLSEFPTYFLTRSGVNTPSSVTYFERFNAKQFSTLFSEKN